MAGQVVDVGVAVPHEQDPDRFRARRRRLGGDTRDGRQDESGHQGEAHVDPP
jgi:hypothetical protein